MHTILQTWLESSEFGTITGNFSGLIKEVVVSPISTTWPSTDPAYTEQKKRFQQEKLLSDM